MLEDKYNRKGVSAKTRWESRCWQSYSTLFSLSITISQ